MRGRNVLLAALVVLASLLISAALTGCTSLFPPTYNPPAYIDEVVAYEAGYHAFQVYMTLRDSTGRETAWPGHLRLEIIEQGWSYEEGEFERQLWAGACEISEENFGVCTVGAGAFAHDILLCNLGRFEYSSFSTQPTEWSGEVRVWFTTPEGRELYGEAWVFFDVD